MTETESVIPTGQARRYATVVVLGLLGCAWLPWMAAPGVRWSLTGAGGLFALWLLWVGRREGHEAVVRIRRPHWVQTVAHASIFGYWGLYVDVVYAQIPLILAQVIFAYGLDMLMAWTRGRKWVIGMGPIPIVGSTNLFLWFHDEVFALQLLMVAAAFLSREFFRWNREGREIHIFNPSGFGLTVASIAVIATGTTEWTWGSTIATTLIQAPYMYEWIFAAGIIIQILFGVCLVTMSAAVTIFGLGYLIFWTTGQWHFENTHIPVAVFLGLHLLITDPVTSPVKNGGKAIFGMLYGLAVFPLYTWLLAINTPSFYDKLLQVPVLNLMAPLIDKIARPIRWPGWRLSPTKTNLVHVVIWAGIFMGMRGELLRHPGQQPGYWDARCSPEEPRACQNLVSSYEGLCRRQKVGPACALLADLFMAGERVPGDETKAVYYYEQACLGESARGCGLGDAQACVEQAARHVDGRGVPKNPSRAAALLSGACERGLAQPCAVLAFMHEHGQGLPPDRAKARALYQKACAGGFEAACRQRDALSPQ